MGVSAQASNIYFNASPSKILKPFEWKEACVLLHTHQTDIPMLHLQNNEALCTEGGMCVSAHD